MNRNQLKSLLKINGLSEASPDEEIKAVLLHAHYNESEIEAAIAIVRDLHDGRGPRVDGLNRVFYTDDALRPSEIFGLLGVDVDLEKPISLRHKNNNLSLIEILFIIFFSILIAVVSIFTYMYFSQVGIFHPLVTQA